jgi:dethiobiotin synthetase
MASGYYVTGTDTGAGKTLVCVTILHALRAQGRRAVGMKPVASGSTQGSEGWRNADALALQEASEPTPPYLQVNPYALPAATAPQIAAAEAGVDVRLDDILQAHAELAKLADFVVVEGVGGWLAPLANGLEQADLARALQLPVILVVAMKLGCLNHARLTERAIRADGLELAGWIGNHVTRDFDHAGEYATLLRRELSAPCLGLLPFDEIREPSRFTAKLRFVST